MTELEVFYFLIVLKLRGPDELLKCHIYIDWSLHPEIEENACLDQFSKFSVFAGQMDALLRQESNTTMYLTIHISLVHS